MNVENILKVADAIEQRSVPGLFFHMDYEFSDHPFWPSADMLDRGCDLKGCDAAACIIGWTNSVFPAFSKQSYSSAAESLGLNLHDADKLFYPTNTQDYASITPAHATAVLRHLAATGKTDWTVQAPAISSQPTQEG